MGTVADYQKKLHYLYEGLELSDPLCRKKRRFQFAHPGALLIRQEDFSAVGGFQEGLGHLAFPSLCIALNKLRPGAFSSIYKSQAILHDRFDSWSFCESWNSTLQRGRLDASAVTSDYQAQIEVDGFSYKIDSWLNEYADLPALADSQDPWPQWRHHPQPLTLIKYISSLPAALQSSAVNLARSLPSSLPRYFDYYLVQNQLIASQAKLKQDPALLSQCKDWLKQKSRFHHSNLKGGMKILKDAGLYNCSLDQSPAIYDAWLELAEKFDDIKIGREAPEIAVLMPVWNPEPGFLTQAIESVLEQDYPKWQLCIADDASTNPAVKSILTSFAQMDRRIKLCFREKNGHICHASNSALELATAPYIAFLDHDDLLAPQALAQNAKAIAENPSLKFLYSDEDHIDIDNVRRSPVFKPDFDGDLFFTGHLSTYDTKLIKDLGGLRPGTEGSQDQDLCLRVCEVIHTENIFHIPKILYHWRVHEKSTAASIQAKPYVIEASRKVLLDATARKGYRAEALINQRNNFFRLLYLPPPDLSASIIIYTDKNCSKPSANLSAYLEKLNGISDLKIDIASYSDDWIENCNRAAQKARGEILAFIYAGLEPGQDCKLEQLLIMARRPDLAMVGGLIWQNGLLYNGGWYPDISGLPFPLLTGLPAAYLKNSAWGQFLLPRHVLGLARECMVIKREPLAKDNFLNPQYGELAPVDFALRHLQKGRYCLASPWGQWNLIPNIGSLSPESESFAAIRQGWGREIANNPLRNPNLRAAPDQDWTLIL